MGIGASRESSSRNGRICLAPSAQFIPTLKSGMCETEIQKASTVWPESVRPLRSTMVTETITGTRVPGGSRNIPRWRRAPALAFSVSKTVSSSSRSAPPSTSARACVRSSRAVDRTLRRARGIRRRPARPKPCATSGPSIRPRSSAAAVRRGITVHGAARDLRAGEIQIGDADLQAVLGHGDARWN